MDEASRLQESTETEERLPPTFAIGDSVSLPAGVPGCGHAHRGEVELIEGNLIGVRVAGRRRWFTIGQLGAAAAQHAVAGEARRTRRRVTKDQYRPMTDDERFLAKRLSPSSISYPPGSSSKRFTREMAAMAEDPDAKITDNQAAFMRSIRHRYRRQLGEG